MPLPSYLHTDLCFYFPVLNVKRAYPPSSLNSCIFLVFATELTGTKGITLFTYTDLFFYFFSGISNLEIPDTKGKDYPFYVHRPVCLIPRTLAPFLSFARTD